MATVSNTKYRFSDVIGEPLCMLAPIEGFNEKPLVSLEKAIEPITSLVPGIQENAAEAKRRVADRPDHFPIDESAAILLYTMEWRPYTSSLYYILNATLRTAERQNLKPWFLYLKLIFTALSHVPTKELTVYRGVELSDPHKYEPGTEIIWWGFSSCSTNRKIAEEEYFFGDTTGKTLFVINCMHGKDISGHSRFRREKEILLLPATTFKVLACTPQRNESYIIVLEEIQSPHALLESVSSQSKIETLHNTSIFDNLRPLISITRQYFNSNLQAEIARFKERSHVALYRRRFTDQDLELIVKEVIVNKQCRALSLFGTEITSQGVTLISESLENNRTLEELFLMNLRIGDDGAEILAQTLSSQTNVTLRRLCLNYTGITDKGAEQLAMMLETNRWLTHLGLPKNRIHDRGIRSLIKALSVNKTLQVLSLEWNAFENDETVESLIQMIEKSETLMELTIDGDGLSRSTIRKLESMAEKKKGFNLKVH